MWRHALIFPDAVEGWAWATRSLVGLPMLVRVLMTLRRAGIRDVMFPPEAGVFRPWLTSDQESAGFPTLSWSDQSGWSGLSAGASVLGVRGGVLFTPQLLHWFHEVLDGTAASLESSGDGLLRSGGDRSGSARLSSRKKVADETRHIPSRQTVWILGQDQSP